MHAASAPAVARHNRENGGLPIEPPSPPKNNPEKNRQKKKRSHKNRADLKHTRRSKTKEGRHRDSAKSRPPFAPPGRRTRACEPVDNATRNKKKANRQDKAIPLAHQLLASPTTLATSTPGRAALDTEEAHRQKTREPLYLARQLRASSTPVYLEVRSRSAESGRDRTVESTPLRSRLLARANRHKSRTPLRRSVVLVDDSHSCFIRAPASTFCAAQ